MSKHTINLIVGDWSHDGHGKSVSIVVEANLSEAEIEAAYKKGSRKIKVDMSATICREYEDSAFHFGDAERFKKHGVSFEGVGTYTGEDFDPCNDVEAGDDYYVPDPEQFADLYLQVAKVGNPELTYKVIEGKELHIGGYGLFC